jgi:hypothetical protein
MESIKIKIFHVIHTISAVINGNFIVDDWNSTCFDLVSSHLQGLHFFAFFVYFLNNALNLLELR